MIIARCSHCETEQEVGQLSVLPLGWTRLEEWTYEKGPQTAAIYCPDCSGKLAVVKKAELIPLARAAGKQSDGPTTVQVLCLNGDLVWEMCLTEGGASFGVLGDGGLWCPSSHPGVGPIRPPWIITTA